MAKFFSRNQSISSTKEGKTQPSSIYKDPQTVDSMIKKLRTHNIETLYHFTDNSNIPSIKKSKKLCSAKYAEENDIPIPVYGGDQLSKDLDKAKGIESYAKLFFVRDSPMYHVVKRKRVEHQIWLEISILPLFWQSTKFSNINATDTHARIGDDLEAFERINFRVLKNPLVWISMAEKKECQAEILVKDFIPIEYIRNL